MQLIGKWITNPQSIGTAIGLKGPMGTGKTTLVKNGISKILNRDFAFITLGGSVDGSTLKGHSYTYEGSTYGKIADILIQTKSSNPIIFFDELDKVSNKSDEIYSVLTHLTDTTQNTEFHDNYFSEIELNLSGCLFVFSYNDETLINPILRDRMYTIEIPGYNMKDKMHISYKHLLPSIVKDIGLTTHDIILNNDILSYIIEITKPEQGVRNLKRNLEIIYSKLNLFRILKTTTIFDKIFDVSFPFILNKETVDKLLKPYRQPESMNISTMYI
jgi:ATP-dependent Lon protease